MMLNPVPLRLALFACAALAALSASPARAADTDFQEWTQLTVQGPLAKRWLGYFELQPRFGENASAIERLIVRPAVGYQVRKNVSVWQGYGYIPQYTPEADPEHRFFQQLIIQGTSGRAALTNRTRLEERSLPGAGGTSLRLRHRLRASYPISADGRWALIGYDEPFVNLNSVSGGPQAGFDQNRIYLGVSRQVNPNVRAELGYIWAYVKRPTGPDRSLHILYSEISISL